MTAMVAWVSNESLVARLWFVVPSLVALQPLLSRRFGTAAMTLAMMLAVAWVVAGRFRPKRESVLIGGSAGAILAGRIGLFLSVHYDGTNTHWQPLLELAATALVATLVFFWLPRLERIWRISTPQRALLAGSATAVATIFATGPSELQWRSPPASAAEANGPPVVIVVLDTVRADHLELYGYHRQTMPSLTRFARSHGLVVDRAITNAPDSLSAHASLFTGYFPSRHGAHRPVLVDPQPPRFGYPLRPDLPTLAEILGDYVVAAARDPS